MSQINWNNLRPCNGSQQSAFEELCCQLANYESIPNKREFIRKGAPDAGVECYWILEDSSEIAWQAKFFITSPEDSQWTQIDKSVETALGKHPALSKYIVCLPIDRSDARIEGRSSFLDKWNERVIKWQTTATSLGRGKIEFGYWGAHEIWERLSREEHKGRHKFWFDSTFLSSEWLQGRLKEMIADAGPRYSPELNVELPIAEKFFAQSLSPEYFKRLFDQFREHNDNLNTCIGLYKRYLPTDRTEAVITLQKQLIEWVNGLCKSPVAKIDFSQAVSTIKLIDAWVRQEFETVLAAAKISDDAEKDKNKHSDLQDVESVKSCRYKVSSSGEDMIHFFESVSTNLVNHPFSLLIGVAGSGKTHLFADIARNLIEEDVPSVLILGEKLSLGDPWEQMLKVLALDCSRDEFLGALQAAAEIKGRRSIIFIDALNESENRSRWSNYLNGMVSAITPRYPNVGIAVSVRSSYEADIFPEHIKDNFIRQEHYGFGTRLTRAVQIYFSHYKIVLPSTPLLSPEFNNPLFLGIFCRTLFNMGVTEMPEGAAGFFDIFNKYISSINDRLSKEDVLDFDKSENLILKFVNTFCDALAMSGQSWMSVEKAKEIALAVYNNTSSSKSLFRHLISEGLLAEDRFYVEEAGWSDGIRFSYERFADHFMAQKILSGKNKEDAILVVKKYFTDHKKVYLNQGLIEALSIQMPEKFSVELADILADTATQHQLREALFESLLWRSASSISDETISIVSKMANADGAAHNKLIESLIYLAPKENHKLNVYFLDRVLKRAIMPDRDKWWSTHLHHTFSEDTALDRVISWVLEIDEASNAALGRNARLQLVILLSWCFSTPNRKLRDRATKAAVRLLENNLNVAHDLFQNFIEVDDLYILERVLAACCGATTRSKNLSGLDQLAAIIFNRLFKDSRPPLHILLRDYGRVIVEFAKFQNSELDIDINKARPPYKSSWPKKIMSKKEIEAKYGTRKDNMSESDWSEINIHTSVMGFGDFARYIIGTNSGSFDWSSQRIRGPTRKTGKERYEHFIKSLSSSQKKYWKAIDDLQQVSSRLQLFEKIGEPAKISPKILLGMRDIAEEKLLKSLNGAASKEYKKFIIPYLKNPNASEYNDNFDLSIAQRFIMERVFTLGWTKERFGVFDYHVDRRSGFRGSNKNERMGKKYQWLAYYEFLALVSDNFKFKGDHWDPKSKTYEGPWQITYTRNIDPSLLLTGSKRIGYKTSANSWWANIPFNNWSGDAVEWLKSEELLPDFERVISSKDSSGRDWLTLDSFVEWYEPLSPEKSKYHSLKRRIWFMSYAYIVKSGDAKRFIAWAKKQDFMGRWMPEPHNVHNIYWGEHFWAPAYKYIDQPYYGHNGWSDGGRRGNKIPVAILSACEKYMCESSGYDMSIDETINFNLLCSWLANILRLKKYGEESKFFDESGNLYSFDPSLESAGPGTLLVDKKIIADLRGKGYEVVWTWLGEKDILGSGHGNKWDGRLEISGVSYFDNDEFKTHKNFKFIPGH